MHDINFAVVNYGDAYSKLLSHRLEEKVDFPVLQEPSSGSVWNLLDGGKDDMLVYDRCGRLNFHVRLPYSNLNYPNVESVINATYFETVTCPGICREPETEEETGTAIGTTEFMVTEFATVSTEKTTMVTDVPDEEYSIIDDNSNPNNGIFNDNLIDKHSPHVHSKK